MTVQKTFGVGIDTDKNTVNNKKLIQYINLKLAALGYPYFQDEKSAQFLDIASPLLHNYREKSRLLSNHLSPIGNRIQTFINDYLSDVPGKLNITLPTHPLTLDTHGLARMMSIPPNVDSYETDIVKSFRTSQGILHNPKADKRTTKGVFHVSEGGLPVPDDKKAVPKITFARLLEAAFNPPKELMRLPYTANQDEKAERYQEQQVAGQVDGRLPFGLQPGVDDIDARQTVAASHVKGRLRCVPPRHIAIKHG